MKTIILYLYKIHRRLRQHNRLKKELMMQEYRLKNELIYELIQCHMALRGLRRTIQYEWMCSDVTAAIEKLEQIKIALDNRTGLKVR